MTLTPETRVLLTDALKPPAGYRVEVAVGTTYSLNLTALLLAPLSFALFDQGNADEIGAVDPIRLLEAVRRHAQHTTVFCQAGGIHVPSKYRSILTFVEDSVLEVLAFNEGALFHPKVWAIRFTNQDENRLHRLIVLSRNLTLDRSWDTALVLDEEDSGAIDAAPAAEFVRLLPTLTLRRLSDDRLAGIEDLAVTLAQARLAVPSPFTSGALIPMGMPRGVAWPFPEQAKRLLAISPFLTKDAVGDISQITSNRTIVSRAESLELMGSKLLEGWDVNVLQRLAEVDPSDDMDDVTAPTPNGFLEANDGLHAKTFVVDLAGGHSTILTGSANLTSAAWGTNVEFDAMLTGPTWACGVETVLNGSPPEVPGLSQILEAYSVNDEDGATDAAIKASYALELFHRQLASSEPELHITAHEDDRVTAILTLTVQPDAPGQTKLWLASLPRDVHAKPLHSTLTWIIAPINVTPFIAVETTSGEGAARVTRRCVLKAELTGAIDGRRQDAVLSVLRSKEDVLRYLVFLLGDPSYDALFAQLAGIAEGVVGSDRPEHTSADVALLEPLVRATGRDEDALARVASLVEELRDLPNGEDLVPVGFEALWNVVWQVHQERRA